MKKFLLIVGIALLPFLSQAQLGNVNIVSYPCILAAGVTGTVIADSVPGATHYEWISNIGHINSVWLPWTPGPVQTSLPSVNILANLSQQVYEICVRAMNATDTSGWTCVQIMGIMDPPVLLASNSTVGIPGDSGYYAITYPSLCPPAGYTWTITGDATFNNSTQSMITDLTGLGVNINFGPNFTSGTLCVAAVSPFGLSSLTVCMLITAPLGINEPLMNVSFISGEDKVKVEFTSTINQKISVILFDVSGKRLYNEATIINSGQNKLEFSTAVMGPGIYFLELSGKYIQKQFKFVKTE